MGIDLTEMQRAALAHALAPFAESVDFVAVYGSRATGAARRGSDVDLVLHGNVSAWHVRSAIEESDLSIFADVVRYDEITNPQLRAEVDRDAQPLFTRAELRAFAKGEATR